MATASMARGGVAVMVLTALCYAVNDVLMVIAYHHGATPGAALLVRLLALILGLLVVLPALGRPVYVGRGFLWPAAVAGLLSYLGSLGLNTAFRSVPVGVALLILYLYPILTAATEGLIEHKPPRPALIACLVTAFGGLALALGAGNGVLAAGLDPPGLVCAFGASLAFTAFFVWSRHRLAGADPGASVLASSTVAAAAAAVAGVAMHTAGVMPLGAPAPGDGTGWLAMAGLSAAFSLAFFGMNVGVQLIGPTRASMMLNLETVFAMPLAALFLAEAADGQRLLGAALVLGAVVVSQALGEAAPASPPGVLPPNI